MGAPQGGHPVGASMGKKKISEMSPEEQEQQRKKWREETQASRAVKRAAAAPDADDLTWTWSEDFPQQRVELRAHEEDFTAKVAGELGRDLSDLEEETLAWVSVTSFCFAKNNSPWVSPVKNPSGVIVGGLFWPDVLGEDLVANTHRFELEKSPTYSSTYRDLLKLLDRKFGKNNRGPEALSAITIRAELAGTYVYTPPAPPEPKPEPPKRIAPPVPVSQVPSDREILLQESEKLIRQLALDSANNQGQDPNITPEARRYLDGV